MKESIIYKNKHGTVLKGSLEQTMDMDAKVLLMDVYEVLSLLFLGGMLSVALLACIHRSNKRSK